MHVCHQLSTFATASSSLLLLHCATVAIGGELGTCSVEQPSTTAVAVVKWIRRQGGAEVLAHPPRALPLPPKQGLWWVSPAAAPTATSHSDCSGAVRSGRQSGSIGAQLSTPLRLAGQAQRRQLWRTSNFTTEASLIRAKLAAAARAGWRPPLRRSAASHAGARCSRAAACAAAAAGSGVAEEVRQITRGRAGALAEAAGWQAGARWFAAALRCSACEAPPTHAAALLACTMPCCPMINSCPLAAAFHSCLTPAPPLPAACSAALPSDRPAPPACGAWWRAAICKRGTLSCPSHLKQCCA